MSKLTKIVIERTHKQIEQEIGRDTLDRLSDHDYFDALRGCNVSAMGSGQLEGMVFIAISDLLSKNLIRHSGYRFSDRNPLRLISVWEAAVSKSELRLHQKELEDRIKGLNN